MKKNNTTIITILLVVIGIGAGFFGGMKYTDYQRTQGRAGGARQFPAGTNGQIQNRNGLGGRPVTGEVINIDDTSITVKTQDGGSKIIMLSNTTTYSKTAEGTIQDVVVGRQVGVVGTENSDKSMTAQTIQLNPQFRMGTVSAQPTPSK
jgi:hypothetical protein